MEKVKREVELPKELCELAEGLGALVGAVRLALADGWQIEKDLPLLLVESMQKLGPAVEGLDKVVGEAKEDPAGAAQAVAVCLLPKLLKK